MKVIQINTFSYKATGNIMVGIHNVLSEAGHDSYIVWGRGRDSENSHEIVIKDDIGMKLHGVFTRLTDKTGFASKKATRLLLMKLEAIKPDIIHLHNIHGYYLNIEMLFNYIQDNHIKVVWTLHDCWPVTGHCAYFDIVGCDKWMVGCHDCQQKNEYPSSMLLDSSAWNWKKKKELFLGKDIILVVPCNWLKEIVSKSFLKNYSVKVLYNGINLEIFKPSYREEVRSMYSPDGKPIVLGVASEWTERKGLRDIIELSKKACDIRFIVVGVTEKQARNIPDTLKAIKRTNNVKELVELYSIADVFFNPTYEDNFPTTNIEALACGTPVVTYNTGGSPEAIKIGTEKTKKRIGLVVEKSNSSMVDFNKTLNAIREMINMVSSRVTNKNLKLNENPIRSACREAALSFDMSVRLYKYLEIYEEMGS